MYDKNYMIKNLKRYKYLYLMFIPVLLWYIIFAYIPLMGMSMAFKEYSFSKGISGSPWIGLKNFVDIFKDEYFVQAFKNSFIIAFMRISFSFPFAIIFALLLQELRSKYYRSCIQTITFIPHFFSWVVMSSLLLMIFAEDRGVVNLALMKIGLVQQPFLNDNGLFRWMIILTYNLKEIGWDAIFYIAAIAGIDPTLYESVTVDGGNRWHMVRHVTIPSIMPVIVVMFILFSGRAFSMGFDQIFNLYNPNVFETVDIMDTYIFRTLRESVKMSIPAAAGIIRSGVSIVFLFLSNWLVHRMGHEGIY